ncbi:tape measure protein [Pseudomonas abietaniphila]|jgi:tape measure domain-containing protein|uniref:tape measure protein n=1 Tax=Pseudomonas abietaniphila TaxID=89065 RepID=UPI000780E72F|nr:tape measure protein [Pseudomonas abietaniphila]
MAGQEVRGMLIRLEATTAQLRQEMAKADSTVAQVSGRIDAQLSRVDSAFDRAGASAQAAAGVLKGALAGMVSVAGISELLKHAEAYTTIANRLKLVTSSAAEFTAAQNAVFDIAQRSGQPLTATAELYQRIATNQKELKLTGQGVAGIVETISKTMVISGASAESANAALIQLGQAFASGTLRGEELNSVLEQAPALAQAIAKGMGVSVGALRTLGASGKLTADSVVKALQAQAGAVNDLFGKMQNTVGAATTRLDNSATNLIGKLDQTSGVSQKLAGVLTSVSQSLDAVSKDGASLSDTAANVTTAVERLAVVIGARLALSVGQATVAFAANTVESIKRFAATMSSISATNAQIAADGRAAWAATQSAQAKALDSTAAMERAKAEVAAAEQTVAADRIRQQSDIASLEMVQAQLIADRELEAQRLKSQITEVGRQQTVARMLELRQAEIAITGQLRTSEQVLAETTIATSAAVQAAMEKDVAATAAWAESKMALNKAVAESKRLEEAAGIGTRAFASTATAAGGLLGLLTGPVGMIATVALVAASFIDFGSSTDRASKALIDHGLTVDQTTQKYKDLSAEQQRFQVATWQKEQKAALNEAASDLDAYSFKVMESLNQINKGSTDYQDQFVRMIGEVKAGTRSLDSVTAWAKDNVKLLPIQVDRLTELSAAYAQNSKNASGFGDKLNAVSVATNSAATSTEKLTAAQQGGGQTSANQVAWDKYIEQLTKTRDLLGANAAAEAVYTAAKMGATPAQAAQAKIIADQTDVLKRYQEAIKQSAEADKARLRAQLVALYAAEDAANETAAAQKKALDDTAKAAEDSASRQVNAMQRVIDQAVNLTKGRNLLLLPDAKPDTKNQTGYGLLTNGGTPPAAPVVPKATPDQRADAAVAQLDATTDANKRVDKAANEAARALKAQQKALGDLLSKSGIAAKASNDMADAYLGGADNVRALTIQQKIEEELLKTGAGARDKVTKSINDMQDAQDRADVSKHIADMRVEIGNLEKEAVATLQGQAAIDAFNVAKSVQAELIGKKIAVGSKEYDQLVAATQAQLDNNKAVEQANKANGIVDRLYPQTKLLRDYTEEQAALNKAMELYPEKADAYRDALSRLGVEYQQNQQATTAWGKFTEGAVDRVDSAFADMWKSVLSKSGNFMDTLKDSFRQFLAELLHMAITKPIIVQFASSLGIGAGAAQSSGLFGGLTGGGGNGITSLLGNVSNTISVAGSKFGQAVMSGWNGGEGLSGGLEGAFNNGADYFKGAVESAFATGTAAAATTASQLATNLTAQGLSSLSVQAGNVVGTNTGLYLAGSGGGLTSSAGAAAQVGAEASFGSAATSTAASNSLATLSVVLSYIQGVYTIFTSFQQYGLKGAAVTGGMAAAGAAIGSYIMPGIGTAIGFAVGAVAGAFGADKLFSSGEKYDDYSTSAQGTYAGGQYNTGGIVQGWQTKAPKYGSAADSQMDSTVAQFTSTLGMLYKVLGDGAQVYAYDMMQVRKTSGKYSTTFGATIDGGGADDLNIHQQFEAADAAAALTANYDDVMGTFLAKAIVSSKSLPDYFKAQFTEFAASWDTTADEVIKAIEGVFTRFNGVNAALERINVNSLKMGENGLIASDNILNIVASMSKLDEATATAQDKVDALNKVVNDYYSSFFSEQEQFDDLKKSLTGAFAGFGLNLPDSKPAFRALVEGIDVTTAAGQAMFATLMGLASSANSYYTALDQTAKDALQAAADASQKLVDAATAANSTLVRSLNAQKASINDMLTTANTRVSDLTSVSSGLSTALKALRGDSDDAVKMLRSQAQATLQSALAIARAGGSLAGFEGLTDALDTVGSNNTDLYSSLEDFNRDQGRTANVVAELNKLNGKQLTSAQQTVKTLQDQLDRLDDQLAFAQQQLDALNGVDNSVLSVKDAVNAMNAAVVAALGGIGGKNLTAPQSSSLIDTAYQSVYGSGYTADAAGKAYWQQQLASGAISVEQLIEAVRNAAKANHTLPGYATGGLISGPGNGESDSIVARLSNGEYIMTAAATKMFGTGLLDQMNAGRIPAFAAGGPVLDISSPSQVFTRPAAPMGGAAGAEGRLEQKVDILIDVIKQIVGPMKVDSSKVRKLLEHWDGDGLPKTTTASATA